MEKLEVTIVFNGKEMTTSLDAVSVNTLQAAQLKVDEAIETFIQRYKLPEILAVKVRQDSYWNQADFTIEQEQDRYKQTHSEVAYQQFKHYLSETNQTIEQATLLAKQWIADYYTLILNLEREGYTREEAQHIVDVSPRRSERQRMITVILGESGSIEESKKIAMLKGFYAS